MKHEKQDYKIIKTKLTGNCVATSTWNYESITVDLLIHQWCIKQQPESATTKSQGITRPYCLDLCNSIWRLCLFPGFLSHCCFDVDFVAAASHNNYCKYITNSFNSLHTLLMWLEPTQCWVLCQQSFLTFAKVDVVSSARSREWIRRPLWIGSQMWE